VLQKLAHAFGVGAQALADERVFAHGEEVAPFKPPLAGDLVDGRYAQLRQHERHDSGLGCALRRVQSADHHPLRCGDHLVAAEVEVHHRLFHVGGAVAGVGAGGLQAHRGAQHEDTHQFVRAEGLQRLPLDLLLFAAQVRRQGRGIVPQRVCGQGAQVIQGPARNGPALVIQRAQQQHVHDPVHGDALGLHQLDVVPVLLLGQRKAEGLLVERCSGMDDAQEHLVPGLVHENYLGFIPFRHGAHPCGGGFLKGLGRR
jgi:hypothetical protein